MLKEGRRFSKPKKQLSFSPSPHPPCWISKVDDFHRAKSGTVWLFRTPTMADCEAWRSNGHIFRQQSGHSIRKGKDGFRVVMAKVTNTRIEAKNRPHSKEKAFNSII